MTKEVIKDKWLNIRLTTALLDKLKDLAESEHRTLSSQAIFILESYFKSKEK